MLHKTVNSSGKYSIDHRAQYSLVTHACNVCTLLHDDHIRVGSEALGLQVALVVSSIDILEKILDLVFNICGSGFP